MTWTLVGVGIVLRVVEYLYGRPFFLDEAFLTENFMRQSPLDFRPLNGQLVPPAFLVLERSVAHVLGRSTYAFRLLPLLCGIASLVLLVPLARRCVAPRAVPIAVALFALSDDQIYYATEFKQYSSDVTAALACLLMAVELAEREPTPKRLAFAAAAGVVATWCSHPAIFVLAGVGISLSAWALATRRPDRASQLAGLGIVWVLSFAGCYLVSRGLMSPVPVMDRFWNFAFLPIPPRSATDLGELGRHVLNVFANPVRVLTPFGPMISAWLGLALSVIGALAIGRTRPRLVGMFVAPALFVMAASAMRAYPFHGRIVLFLVPGLLLLIAQGVDAIGQGAGRAAFYGLIAVLLTAPSLEVLCALTGPRAREVDEHGDLHRDLFRGEFRPGRSPWHTTAPKPKNWVE